MHLTSDVELNPYCRDMRQLAPLLGYPPGDIQIDLWLELFYDRLFVLVERDVNQNIVKAYSTDMQYACE